jgi:hypothetical protein
MYSVLLSLKIIELLPLSLASALRIKSVSETKPSLALTTPLLQTIFPVTLNLPSGLVVPIPTFPDESIRNRSVEDSDPSADVLNVILPGMSPSPGVPSTAKLILEDEA